MAVHSRLKGVSNDCMADDYRADDYRVDDYGVDESGYRADELAMTIKARDMGAQQGA